MSSAQSQTVLFPFDASCADKTGSPDGWIDEDEGAAGIAGVACADGGGVGGDKENRSSVDSRDLPILGSGGTCAEGSIGGTGGVADIVGRLLGGRGGGCKAL